MSEEEAVVYKEDEYGQSILPGVESNYFPVATDYGKIPNRFIEKFGNISYIANLGMMLAIQRIEKRSRENYIGTKEGNLCAEVYAKSGTDFSDGLVACIPISQFLKIYKLGTSGRVYQSINDLYNSTYLAAQWRIMYEDNNVIATTSVLTGTMYSKETKCLYMKFNPDLEQTLLDIKKDYARISLPVLGILRDDFTANLYQILKKRHDAEQARNRKYGLTVAKEVKITFEVDRLMFLLNIYPIDTSDNDPDMIKVVELIRAQNYKGAAEFEKEKGMILRYDESNVGKQTAVEKFSYFRRHFLDRAFKRINGFAMIKSLESSDLKGFADAYEEYEKACAKVHPTDIHFRYGLERSGVGGHVENISFYVSLADWSTYQEIEENGDEIIEIRESLSMEQEEILEDVVAILEEESFSTENIINLCEKANWSIEVIENAYAAAVQQRKKKKIDMFGFMVRAVEGKWTPNPESTVGTESKAPAKENESMEEIRARIGYDDLIAKNPEYEQIIEALTIVMQDTFKNRADVIEVGTAKYDAKDVKERLYSLDSSDIENAVEAFIAYSSDAPTEKYLLSLLYNSHVRVNLSELRKQTMDKKVYPQKKKAPKGRFTDFPQRTITKEEIAAMERKKLGYPMPGEEE